jgi:hypothetical protein
MKCVKVLHAHGRKRSQKNAPEEENSGANKKRGRSKGFGQG